CPSTTVTFSLSLHDALPIYSVRRLLVMVSIVKLESLFTICRSYGDLNVLDRICIVSEESIRINGILTICWIQLLHLPEVLCQLRSEEHTSELQSRENLVCRL